VSKRALVLESIGDTVYVMKDGLAERRDVELGFQDAESVEVLSGVEEGERVIVVGQDGLSAGTPVYVLSEARPTVAPPGQAWPARSPMPPEEATAAGGREQRQDRPSGAPVPAQAGAAGPGQPGPPGGARRFDPANLTPEQLDRLKERMRQFGLTDEQIEQRIQQMKDGTFTPPGRPGGNRPPAGN